MFAHEFCHSQIEFFVLRLRFQPAGLTGRRTNPKGWRGMLSHLNREDRAKPPARSVLRLRLGERYHKSSIVNRQFSIPACLLFLVLPICLMTPAVADTLVDQLRRQVAIPDNPQRVIAMAPSITEIIYALEQENRLIGATRYSDYPIEATKLPKIGSYVRPDLERIVALNPDLCIATKDGNPKEIIN